MVLREAGRRVVRVGLTGEQRLAAHAGSQRHDASCGGRGAGGSGAETEGSREKANEERGQTALLLVRVYKERERESGRRVGAQRKKSPFQRSLGAHCRGVPPLWRTATMRRQCDVCQARHVTELC